MRLSSCAEDEARTVPITCADAGALRGDLFARLGDEQRKSCNQGRAGGASRAAFLAPRLHPRLSRVGEMGMANPQEVPVTLGNGAINDANATLGGALERVLEAQQDLVIH